MITILLSTYNGAKYLEQQLQSLFNQQGVNFKILVRDDGSTDETIDILNKWQDKNKLCWYSGINLGPALSFLDLLKEAPDSDFYAFCDQDDIWLPNKLRVAVESLKDKITPSLYFSQTQLVDESLNILPTKKINPLCVLEEGAVSNYVTGCTVVINNRLRSEVVSYQPSYLTMHDSWIYLVCLCLDGYIHFDSDPNILYRQHSNNVIGLRRSRWSEFKRHLSRARGKKAHQRSLTAKELLNGYQSKMSKSKICFLNMLANYNVSIKLWLQLLFSPTVKSVSPRSNVIFRLAVLLLKF